MAGNQNKILIMAKYIILTVLSLFTFVIGMYILMNYAETPWGLLIALTSIVGLGAGLSNLEKELKKYDFKNRNK
jgi:F0F1-type ATP synthase assembly protein I